MEAGDLGLSPAGVARSVIWIKPTSSPYPFQVNATLFILKTKFFFFSFLSCSLVTIKVGCVWKYLSMPVLVRKRNGIAPQSFDRPWVDFKTGFGDVHYWNREYWLGLEKLHLITTSACYRLNFFVHASDHENHHISYKKFKVENESTGYRVTMVYAFGIDGMLSPVPSFNSYGMSFSTFDNDNDMSDSNCAMDYQAGWWYNNCTDILPTGRWSPPGINSTLPYLGWGPYCDDCNIEWIDAKLQRTNIKPC